MVTLATGLVRVTLDTRRGQEPHLVVGEGGGAGGQEGGAGGQGGGGSLWCGDWESSSSDIDISLPYDFC